MNLILIGNRHSIIMVAIEGRTKSYCVFNVNHIKSIGNKGSFSKSSNNINESKDELKTFVDSLKEKYDEITFCQYDLLIV